MSNLLQLCGNVEIQAAAGTKPKFTMIAYSGGPMSPVGWPNVVIDLAGASIGGDIPILSGHADSLDSIVGQGQAAVQNHQLHLSGTITDATSAGQKVVALARSGISLQASVGFSPDRREHISAGSKVSVNGRTLTAGSQGLTIIRSGRLREVSLLPIGADPDTQVKIAATGGITKGTKMETEPTTPDTKPDSERIITRWNKTTFHDPSIRTQTERYFRAALAGDIDYPAFDCELLRAEARDLRLRVAYDATPKPPPIYGSTRDLGPQVIEAAFCRSLGLKDPEKHYDPAVLEAADHLGTPSLQELVLHAAIDNGYGGGRLRIDAGNIREVLRFAFSPGIRAAGFSTLDVSSILSNTANKVLAAGFSSVEQTWRLISKIRPVKDFKDSVSHRLTDSLEYEEVGKGGEIKHGTLGEETYTNKAKTHARMLSLTRQDIINDDLGAFDSIRDRLGRGAALKLNKVFWTAFLDDAAFFTEARGNLLKDVLSDDPASLDDAVAAFAALADGDGNPLGILPAILLVPPILSPTAKRLFQSTEIRNTASDTQYVVANVYQGMFKPAVSAYLSSSAITGNSSTAWWLLADPAVLPAMEVCFLDGQESPTIESADADFNTLGVQFRGYHDFGCVKAEFRAGTKSTGLGGE